MNGFGVTDKGVRRRENQDHFHIQIAEEEDRGIFVVCDGMGGAKAGGVASRLAAITFVDAINEMTELPGSPHAIEEILQNAVATSNRAVYRMSQMDAECSGMGTTLVGAFVSGNTVTIINVGDSRAYHIKKTGIYQITRDHSVVEDMILRGDLTRDEAATHPNKNLITRALGTEATVSGDIFHLVPEKGERILLCSDGLTNVISEKEILAELEYGHTPERSCEMLMHLAIAGGAPDNVTIVIFAR